MAFASAAPNDLAAAHAMDNEVSADAFLELLATATRPVQVYAPAIDGTPGHERVVTIQPLGGPVPPPPRNRPEPKTRRDGSARKDRKRFFEQPQQCANCKFFFELIAQYSGHRAKCTPEHPWDGRPSRSRSRILPGAISCGPHIRKRNDKKRKRARPGEDDTEGASRRAQPERDAKRARTETEAIQRVMAGEQDADDDDDDDDANDDEQPQGDNADAADDDLAMFDSMIAASSLGDRDIVLTDVIAPAHSVRGASPVRTIRLKKDTAPMYIKPEYPPLDPVKREGAAALTEMGGQEMYAAPAAPPPLHFGGQDDRADAAELGRRAELMDTSREEYERNARQRLDACDSMRGLLDFDDDLAQRLRTIIDVRRTLMERIAAQAGSSMGSSHVSLQFNNVALHPAALSDAAAPMQGSTTLMPRESSSFYDMNSGFMSPGYAPNY